MIIWGINDSSHDAALSVISDSKILFASHSERYNKVKNTYEICPEIVNEALRYGEPDSIAYFENRTKKRIRKLIYGGINGKYENDYRKINKHLKSIKETKFSHHYSHAAAGYFTSKYDHATIVVIDAIGEFETATIWVASKSKITKLHSLRYPVSFGLFYSAFTKLVGLVPGTEEYILMGMAGFGDKTKYADEVEQFFPRWDFQPVSLHCGVRNWNTPIANDQDKFDIAAACQDVYEKRLLEIMQYAKSVSPSRNLVFMGGCALNCLANTKLLNMWDDIWIMPNPGDAGSSLGAAAAMFGRHIEWTGPYLGSEIQSKKYPVSEIISALSTDGIVAVASGRAEFGPRALGNRSILADPRHFNQKSKINELKKREKFRPFAPVVREEIAHEWFDISSPSPYMQYAVRAKFPKMNPAVVHVDGTSRVQTVSRSQHCGLYETLLEWEKISSVPILLNTSLNIKNQPLINDIEDVRNWERANPGMKVAI
jgi:carbamoyltransferase